MTDDFEPSVIDWQVSVIPYGSATDTATASLRQIIADIRGPKWAKQVEAIQAAFRHGAETAVPKLKNKVMETIEQARIRSAKDAASPLKMRLPGVLFSGVFSQRNAESITRHSGLICVDLDHLDNVAQTKEQVASDPHTLAAFTSPTGTGLKVVFRCNPSVPHIASFAAAEHYCLAVFGLNIDQACKDVCRICFVSHDPEAFMADDAVPLPDSPTPVEFKAPVQQVTGNTPGDDYDRRGDVERVLTDHGWTKSGTQHWTRPGKTSGISASLNVIPGRFWVFSSEAEGFEPQHTYRPWHVYAILEHGGDYSAAARKLAQDGYGEKSRQQQNLDRLSPEPVLEKISDPLIARPITDFALPPKGDSSVLIGKRWLCRGDGAILSSTSGMGKSTLSIQLAIQWALGLAPFKAFKPHKPLTSLIFQSEDSNGDVAEMQLSICHALQLTPQDRALVATRVRVVTDRVNRGDAFIKAMREQIAIHKPDLVWINPLLAFLGSDVNDAEEVGHFLRGGLNGANEQSTHAYIVVHHTSKPPKEKTERRWSETMYDMAGSADLTNWARAVLSLRAGEVRGEFNLVLAKRGIRAGATILTPGDRNPEIKVEQPTDTIPIKHSGGRFTPEGHDDMPLLFWEMCERPVLEMPAKSGAGRRKDYQVDDFEIIFPVGIKNAKGFRVLHREAKEIKPTIGGSAFERIIDEALNLGKLKIDRENPRQPKYYSA